MWGSLLFSHSVIGNASTLSSIHSTFTYKHIHSYNDKYTITHHIHSHTHTSAVTHTLTHLHVLTHCIHTHTHTYIYTYIITYTHTMCIHMCTHTHTLSLMHTNSFINNYFLIALLSVFVIRVWLFLESRDEELLCFEKLINLSHYMFLGLSVSICNY